MSSTVPDFDATHFRAVLGEFPTGVTVVTGLADGQPHGVTIGSFTSVSLEPPLVGFFIVLDSETWAAIGPTGQFCVNVLNADQADLCWRFARPGLDDSDFDDLDWTRSPLGLPILPGVAAWIDCTVERTVRLGDHDLVVGAVSALDHHAEIREPLVFHRGTLGRFSGEAG